MKNISAKYLYHFTTFKNFKNIKKEGLIPYDPKKSKFSPLSPELYRRKEKLIFLIPNLTTKSTKIFLDEWWHGEINNIVLLRVLAKDLKIYGSLDDYYSECEVWCYDPITPNLIEYRIINKNNIKYWKSLI